MRQRRGSLSKRQPALNAPRILGSCISESPALPNRTTITSTGRAGIVMGMTKTEMTKRPMRTRALMPPQLMTTGNTLTSGGTPKIVLRSLAAFHLQVASCFLQARLTANLLTRSA